jgi:hypothetical protein
MLLGLIVRIIMMGFPNGHISRRDVSSCFVKCVNRTFAGMHFGNAKDVLCNKQI